MSGYWFSSSGSLVLWPGLVHFILLGLVAHILSEVIVPILLDVMRVMFEYRWGYVDFPGF